VVGEHDNAIPLADQLAMAKAADARIVTVDAPHLSMLTDARTVTNVIVSAATAH
jgi:hypothetical protein